MLTVCFVGDTDAKVKSSGKWPIVQAIRVANELSLGLSHCCHRIMMVGSIRRCKPFVSDIELLYIPRFRERQADLLSTEKVNEVDEKLNEWLKSGLIEKRKNVRGFEAWGPKNKLAVHVPSGIPVDFFETTEENWWVSLVIRTGGKVMNLALTTGANKRNRTLNAYGCGVTDRKTGEVIRATSECHLFELCGVQYLEPEERL